MALKTSWVTALSLALPITLLSTACSRSEPIVSTLAGDGTDGSQDGQGEGARFQLPHGLAVNQQGIVYVSDTYNHLIRKVDQNGKVSLLAGSGNIGSANGKGINASFNYPMGIAVDGQGIVYVADAYNHIIRKITPEGDVSTLAGSSGSSGTQDGTSSQARFNYPFGIATDKNGVVYVSESGNNLIRKVDKNGDTTTLAGDGSSGFLNGIGKSSKFNGPRGLVLDSQGNIYVSDTDNHRIRILQTSTTVDVKTFAGNGVAGRIDSSGENSEFNRPYGIAIDPQGNLYVAEASNNRIRKITPAGAVSTFAGSGLDGLPDGVGVDGGYKDGLSTSALFASPRGVAVDQQGNVYVADTLNNRIRKISP